MLNTHRHGDHMGGNGNLGRAGALIVAHDHGRTRVSREQFIERMQRRVPASPAGALPVVSARPTAELDAEWGGGFISPDCFVETVCRSVGSR